MRINSNFAKIENGRMIYAPNILFDGDVQIINASAEKYAEHGYLPIDRTEQPEIQEGFYFTPTFTEADGKIVQAWGKHEIPEADEATETDYINALEDLGVNFNE